MDEPNSPRTRKPYLRLTPTPLAADRLHRWVRRRRRPSGPVQGRFAGKACKFWRATAVGEGDEGLSEGLRLAVLGGGFCEVGVGRTNPARCASTVAYPV